MQINTSRLLGKTQLVAIEINQRLLNGENVLSLVPTPKAIQVLYERIDMSGFACASEEVSEDEMIIEYSNGAILTIRAISYQSKSPLSE